MTKDLPTLSDHVLHWLITEEEISDELRAAIETEQNERVLTLKQPQELITLTSKLLHDASTCGYHGFTKAQAAVFGFKWPMKGGWLKSLIGKTVTVAQYKKFVDAAKRKK